MTDSVLPNPSGTGPLPGGDAAPPLLPGSQAVREVPPSDAEIDDPSPAEPPVIPGGAEPA
jgi:hypothetical protein